MIWQPIETVPKDGRKVLVYAPCWAWDEPVLIATWIEWADGSRACMEGPHGEALEPTHWMPYPEPPA